MKIIINEHIKDIDRYLGIFSRQIRLFNSDASALAGSGNMQNYLTHPTSEINEYIVFAEMKFVDHLLYKFERRLAIHFWRKRLVKFVQLVRITNRKVVTHYHNVMKQVGGGANFVCSFLNRGAFILKAR